MIVIEVLTEWLASFIEIVLYFTIVGSVMPEQFKRKKQLISLCAISAIIAIGVVLLNFVDLSFSIMTVIYSIFALSLGACILFRANLISLMLIAISYITGLNFLDGCTAKLIGNLWSWEAVRQFQSDFSTLRIYFIIIFKCIEIPIALLVCLILKRLSRKPKKSLLTFFFSLFSFVCCTYWMTSIDGIAKDLNLTAMQTTLAVALIFVICSLYFYYRLIEIRYEKEYTALQNKLLENNYQLAKEAYESNARLYHDMRNHFLLIQRYLQNGNADAAQSYLRTIIGNEISFSTESLTGIEAVDYILSHKTGLARSRHIKTNIHAEYPKDCLIEPVDLCTILTNLLDNAIEACEKQSDGIERTLSVTIRRIHHFIIIRIENSCANEPHMVNGNPVTSKKDSKHHGLGIASVRKAIEKYNGTLEYQYENFTFTVTVMLFYQ